MADTEGEVTESMQLKTTSQNGQTHADVDVCDENDSSGTDVSPDGHLDDGGKETWGGRFEFVLSVIGYTVGLGNIWRFPYFVYRNGGGVALIPYWLFLITCGGPLYYIEVCLGQFSAKSPVGIWSICPLFKGVGWVTVLLSFIFIWYFGLSIAWAFYFLIQSFYPTLGWSHCNNDWNTPYCIDASTNLTEKKILLNITTDTELTTSGQEFWENNVLVKSSGIDVMGSVQLHMLGCIVLGWLVVFLCLIRGVGSLGKVVYVTATFPYILLTVLLIRAVTLDGASDGLYRYLNPDFSKLAGRQVWMEAAIQCFYSLGPAWGGVVTMASFNKFRHNNLRDTLTVCFADGFTGCYSGLVVYSVLGFLAKETGTPFEKLPFAGASLAFIAYPEAISRLPLPHVWAILFFVTLVLVGIDSVFGSFEAVTCTLIDIDRKRFNKYKTPLTVTMTLVLILASIPLAMEGGYYIFMLVDWYIATFNIVVVALMEVVIVAWVYGAARFSCDIEMMTGSKTSLVVRIFWCFLIPIFMLTILTTSVAGFSPPSFGEGGYTYPCFAVVIGNCVAFGPLLCIVFVATWQILTTKGPLLQRVRRLLRPSDEWRPNDNKAREILKCQPYIYEDTLRDRFTHNILGIHGIRETYYNTTDSSSSEHKSLNSV